MKSQLCVELVSSLGIPSYKGESAESHLQRLVYSTVGLQMLASLYDFDDDADDMDNGTVSMQHFCRRGIRLFRAYNALFGTNFDENEEAESIRKQYCKCGYALHRANRLTYPKETSTAAASIWLTRGQVPWTVSAVSGLGTYSLQSIGSIRDSELTDINQWMAGFEKTLKWVNAELPADIEFLNIDESPKKGYWLEKVPHQNRLLFRTKNVADQRYGIADRTTGSIAQLSDWQVLSGEYIRIAIALRMIAGFAPECEITALGPVAFISSSYLLPPKEQNLFELYSWKNERNSPWGRFIAIELVPYFKQLFALNGFAIREV